MKLSRSLAVLMALLMLLTTFALADYPEGTLYRGVKGHREEVEFLQYMLYYAGYLGEDISDVDGVFGKKTEAAVMKYQKEHGLAATGVADAETLRLLEEDWDNSMEPQGGEEPHERCWMELDDFSITSVVPCTPHMHLITETSDLQENPTTESLQAAIDLWLADLDSLYQEWMALQPERAERIGDVQAAFMDYYQVNLALWNAQFGSSPSPEALQKACTMLADHALAVCCTLDECYAQEMSE